MLFLLQCVANLCWEWSFYGALSPLTRSITLGSAMVLLLGAWHAGSAIAWFAGSSRGGWALVVLCPLLLGAYPAPIALLILATCLLVLLDLMVEQHRREQAARL